MPGNVTQANARARAQLLAGAENSSKWTDAQWDTELESSLGKLYDIVLESCGPDWWTNTTEVHTTVAGTEQYTIFVTVGDQTPAPIYRIFSVDVLFEGDWRRIRPYQHWEALDASEEDTGWTNEQSLFYRTFVTSDAGPLVQTVARTIRFVPTPQGAHSFRVRYAPSPGDWSALGAGYSMMGFSGWEDFVVYDTVSRFHLSEESLEQFQLYNGLRREEEDRIRRAARNLDYNDAERVRDVWTSHPSTPKLWPDLRRR